MTTEAPPEGAPGAPETPPATPPAQPPAAPPPPAAEPPAPPQANDVQSLPDWAQKMIGDLRNEAAGNRTKAKTAEEERNELLAKLGQALGVTDEETPDPAKLASDLEATQAEARVARIEAAAVRAAVRLGANPDALLDSRSFLDNAARLDPAADTFSTDLESAISQALEANPLLKTTGQAPGKSGADHTGDGGGKHIFTVAEIQAMTPEDFAKNRDEIFRQQGAGLIK